MTNGNDPITPAIYRQTGEKSSRIATKKDIEQGQHLIYTEGLTKREHFAGQVLQGLMSNPDGLRELRKESGDNWDAYNRLVSGISVMMADALIAALNKPTE